MPPAARLPETPLVPSTPPTASPEPLPLSKWVRVLPPPMTPSLLARSRVDNSPARGRKISLAHTARLPHTHRRIRPTTTPRGIASRPRHRGSRCRVNACESWPPTFQQHRQLHTITAGNPEQEAAPGVPAVPTAAEGNPPFPLCPAPADPGRQEISLMRRSSWSGSSQCWRIAWNASTLIAGSVKKGAFAAPGPPPSSPPPAATSRGCRGATTSSCRGRWSSPRSAAELRSRSASRGRPRRG